jgi:hypothetical protein
MKRLAGARLKLQIAGDGDAASWPPEPDNIVRLLIGAGAQRNLNKWLINKGRATA